MAAESAPGSTVVVQEAPAVSSLMKGLQAGDKKDGVQLGFGFHEPNMRGVFVAGLREMFATMFFLYFNIINIMFNTVNGVSDAPGRLMTAFQFGLAIFVLVYIFADKSGANINPAVTFSLMTTKRVSIQRGVVYIIMQCIGAVLGTLFARGADEDLFSAAGGGANKISDGTEVHGAISTEYAFFAEVLGTSLLCLTVLHGTSEGYIGKHMGPQLPLAIGMAVFIAHLALIPIDGCSINPARSFGPALISGNWGGQALFWFAPLSGALLSSIVYEMFGWLDRITADLEEGDVTGSVPSRVDVTKAIEV